MKVRARNGLVFDLPDAVATGLLGSRGSGFEPFETAPPAPESEPTPESTPEPAPGPKKRPGRPRKS